MPRYHRPLPGVQAMGGPCMCNGVAVGASTDNFAIALFRLDDAVYWSAEHAYQALKMRHKQDREKVVACAPKKGESAWDYGMRVWNLGQRGPARADWESAKVDAMYQANKAKLEQTHALAAELCATTGPLTHRGSGAFWDKWNPILLTLIREELKGDQGDAELMARLRQQMEAYRKSAR